MKYLKIYENEEYKIGDFLKIESNNERIKPYHIVEIVDVYFYSLIKYYVVEYINQKINKVKYINIKHFSDSIKRLATQEEIEKYIKKKNLIININKYNV